MALPTARRATVERYAEALALYRAACFEPAVRVLEAALAADPEDGPSRALLARCSHHVSHPPAMPFEGVSNLEK